MTYQKDRLGGLVVIAPARRAGDPGSIPGPGENFSLKLLTENYESHTNTSGFRLDLRHSFPP